MNDREQWLRERKNILSASDVAAIIGEHPFKTNIDVYMDKISDDICQEDKDHLAFGRDVEDAIAKLYLSRTGNKVIDPGATTIIKHPYLKWLGATLDRYTIVDNEKVPLELKHVGGVNVIKDDWISDPPLYNQIQLQIQCACAGKSFGVLAGMFPGYQLGFKELEFSKSFFDDLYPAIDKFWNYNVKKKIPPSLVEHDKNLDAVKRLYEKEDGKTITLNEECFEKVKQWESLKYHKNELSKSIKKTEAEIRFEIGNATFAAMPDGRYLSLKTTKRKEFLVEATEFRSLRTTKKMR